jgi:hypothetical protein
MLNKYRSAAIFCHLVLISPTFYEQLSRTKVFCAAFLCLQCGFVIFWQKYFGAKAAHKMLVKLTPGCSMGPEYV